MKKTAATLAFTAAILMGTTTRSHATYPVAVVADVPQTMDTVMNITQWLADRVEQLNQLAELVENNALTQTIMGYNEMMTALQTDMSDIMGTVSTLTDAPTQIFDDIQDSGSSIFGMFDTKSWLGDFEGMFSGITNGFRNLSLSQIGSQDANMNYINNNGGLHGFMNQIGGTKTALNTAYLEESQNRQQKMAEWNKQTYGGDAAQVQATQTDILAGMYREQVAAQERESMDRLYESAQDAAYEEQLRARAHKADIQTSNWFEGQFK